jgi:hypothetical protein
MRLPWPPPEPVTFAQQRLEREGRQVPEAVSEFSFSTLRTAAALRLFGGSVLFQ